MVAISIDMSCGYPGRFGTNSLISLSGQSVVAWLTELYVKFHLGVGKYKSNTGMQCTDQEAGRTNQC